MNKWNKEKLEKVIRANISISECLRQLGLKPLGSNFKTFKKYVAQFQLDTSHFLGRGYMQGQKRTNAVKKNLKDFLIENSTLDPSHLKKRLIDEGLLPYICANENCGISDWYGQKLVLHLDHINGINNDHRLENLRLLCPNCHSQTETYCGRNNRIDDKSNKCIDCQANINYYSDRCRSCAAKHSNVPIISWPKTENLLKLVSDLGYAGAARTLGVSGNAVKKRLHNHKK